MPAFRRVSRRFPIPQFKAISKVIISVKWRRAKRKNTGRRYRTHKYPWPEAPNAKQRAAVEAAAQAVLDARKEFPDATLADLYDPLAMPPALVKAHAALDRAVDVCYRPQPFENDRQRVEHLFALYEKLTAPLLPAVKKRRSRARSN